MEANIGRRLTQRNGVFVMVSFFVDPGESLEGMDIARQDVTLEMASLHPDVEVTVLFRSAPAK